MRWPNFFGRGSAATGARGAEPRRPVREWASLPALQRVVGEPELTAPTAAFVHSLAGTHDPELSLEPLGHHVSLEGPAGLVTGLARNVETYAASSELIGRPAPRREARVQRRASGSDNASVELSTADETAEADAPTEPVLMSFTVIDGPVQFRAPLTRMADPDASALLRLAMPRPAPATGPAAIHEPAAADAPPQFVARPVAAQRLTLGQSRRLGLGAPLSPERAASVQRAVETPSLDLAAPARAPRADHIEEAAPPEVAGAREVSGDEPVTAPVERVAPVGGAQLARATVGQTPSIGPGLELPLARQAAAESVEAVPTLGYAVIQRAAARPLPPLYSPPAATPTAPIAGARPALLTVRRTAGSVEAPAEAATPEQIEQLPARASGALPFLGARDDLRHVVAPIPSWEAGSPYGAAIRPLPPLASLAPPTIQRATPMAQDFVAFSPLATPPVLNVSQRTASLTEAPAVQREVVAGEVAPAPEAAAGSAAVATAASAGVEAAAPSGQSDKDLDELARKLHDRISLRLRRDLLIERERAGLVTDLR